MAFQAPVATDRCNTGISTGKLAIWILLASEIVIFGGLVAVYLLLRLHEGAAWGAEAAHTNVVAGAINTFILLTSSFFIVLAHQAAEQDDRKKAVKFMYLTLLCALGFLVVKAYEYTYEISHGYTWFRSNFWGFYYTATFIHASHVIAGGIAIFIAAQGVKVGYHMNRVEVCGIYWHFVDLVWIFLFPLLYIAK